MFNWLKSKPQKFEKPKTLGQMGEEFAQQVYREYGYDIIGTNVYNKKGLRKGEIDFIAKNKQQIIFVEVKTRNVYASKKFGTAEEAVNWAKQIKLLKAVKIYLLKHQNYLNLQPQIDVCALEYDEVDKTFKCAKIITNAVEDWN